LNRKLGGRRTSLALWTKRKSPFPEIEPRLLGCPARNLVTVLITLSQLPIIIIIIIIIIIAVRGGAVC
jgi:hypothetical protein